MNNVVLDDNHKDEQLGRVELKRSTNIYKMVLYVFFHVDKTFLHIFTRTHENQDGS